MSGQRHPFPANMVRGSKLTSSILILSRLKAWPRPSTSSASAPSSPCLAPRLLPPAAAAALADGSEGAEKRTRSARGVGGGTKRPELAAAASPGGAPDGWWWRGGKVELLLWRRAQDVEPGTAAPSPP